MSVRPTQTKSGYPRRSRQPYPTAVPDPVPDPATEATAPPETPSASVRPEPVPADPPPAPGPLPSRVDRRAARRMRRNLAIVCGVVVAVCLILTILIVNMARTRPSALALAPRSALGVDRPSPVSFPFPSVPSSPTRDAPASEGGNP